MWGELFMGTRSPAPASPKNFFDSGQVRGRVWLPAQCSCVQGCAKQSNSSSAWAPLTQAPTLIAISFQAIPVPFRTASRFILTGTAPQLHRAQDLKRPDMVSSADSQVASSLSEVKMPTLPPQKYPRNPGKPSGLLAAVGTKSMACTPDLRPQCPC